MGRRTFAELLTCHFTKFVIKERHQPAEGFAVSFTPQCQQGIYFGRISYRHRTSTEQGHDWKAQGNVGRGMGALPESWYLKSSKIAKFVESIRSAWCTVLPERTSAWCTVLPERTY